MNASRTKYTHEWDDLYKKMMMMSGKVEEALNKSLQAFQQRDIQLAEAVIQGDNVIDAMELEIEYGSFELIALHAPMGPDLRQIGTMLKMVTDLERIADHASSIAKATIRLQQTEKRGIDENLSEMGQLVIQMLHKALDAYMKKDVPYAEEVALLDDEIDGRHKANINEIVTLVTEHGSLMASGTQLLLISGYLERVGDHVTNLCEWIFYMVNGSLKDLNE
ncbi:phosphate signaling complex protein PhoU [Rubeoparvulum massiliense]|uniref:phosphate signaling complex protein PhoU n=1 Tax=Rubeoparvulum massiliense TaxID=1631346 RepID=UPI00065E14A6|nr:phosphate signaling complex protein PhoU [Rubeoparvulum massiliense]